MEIGDNIRKARLARDYSQEKLASKLGVSQTHLDRLEKGEQGAGSEMILGLAKALHIPPFKLLMTEGEWDEWRAICPDKESSESTQTSASE